jgi:F-type H+-transporting ATPase subunit b
VKQILRTGCLALALGLALGAMTLPARAQASHAGVAAMAQSQPKSQVDAQKSNGPPEQMDAPETERQHKDYLYSSSVQWFAKKLGLPVKTMAQIFEWLNSGILLFVIFYFLFKALPGIFRRRTERLQKDLVEAKQVSDDAKRRLAAIEERLSHLDAEIEAFRKRSEHEAAEEERRMHEALETERQRIVHSAEQEIDAASAMAQRNLRRYAAELALGQVRSSLKVDADRDKALVAEFAKSITGKPKGEQS